MALKLICQNLRNIGLLNRCDCEKILSHCGRNISSLTLEQSKQPTAHGILQPYEKSNFITSRFQSVFSKSKIYVELACMENWKKQKIRLCDILMVRKLAAAPPKEIASVWFSLHDYKDIIADIVTPDTYNNLMQNSKKYANFMLPFPNGSELNFISLNFDENIVFFYTKSNDLCLKVFYFPHFISKDIVLLRGEYDSNSLLLEEATWLIKQMQIFYCENQESKLELLHVFNKSPARFNRNDLIREMRFENYGKALQQEEQI